MIAERIEQVNVILEGLIRAIQKVIEHNCRTIDKIKENSNGGR